MKFQIFLAGVDSLGTDKDTYSQVPSQVPHMSDINDTLVSQKSKRFCKKSIRLKRFKMMRWIKSANRIRFEQSN